MKMKNKEFTRDDLQFADVVTLRNGERYVVADNYLHGEDFDYYKDCCDIYDCYNDDLTQRADGNEYDIVKVERNGKVVYEREIEVKEMTVEEISKKLGYEVKIVKEKKEEQPYKFKVGDKVIGNKKADYIWTDTGWVGTVTNVSEYGFSAKDDSNTFDWLNYDKFDLYEE